MRVYVFCLVLLRHARRMNYFGSIIGASIVFMLSGCASSNFSYISETYVSLSPQVVTIGCKEPYEVYDNRQLRRMLIVSNALREVAGCNLNEMRIGSDVVAGRAQRFRAAARTYLDETVREDCIIGSETPLDLLKTEFSYTCIAPVEQPGTKVPRLPGRRSGGGGSSGFGATDDDD